MVARLFPWLLPLVGAWILFCTLQAAAVERILSLNVVESYGFAAYEQVIRNQALHGDWGQTIHRGYIPHWMWSGHRSLWLLVAVELYRWAPGPQTLVALQTGIVALGCIPAWGLGQRTVGSIAGGVAGLAIYAFFGPLWALALQDYQDLVLGIPFALAAVWALRERSLLGFAIAGVLCGAAREEWVVTLPVIALAAGGGWRHRLNAMGTALATSGALALVLWWLGRDAVGYETPMQTHAGGMGMGLPPIQRNWTDYQRFYSHFLFPLNFGALLSPLVLAPGAGALLLHLTTPEGSGIDTQWRGHIHHMAPIAAFLLAAAIDGLGVLSSFVFPAPGRPRWKAFLGFRSPPPTTVRRVAAVLIVFACGWYARPWATPLRLDLRAWPSTGESEARPEWALLGTVPDDARIATDPRGALLLVRFRSSWTYGESLDEKTRTGLGVLDYVLVRRSDSKVMAEVTGFGGTAAGETPEYVLMKLPSASRLKAPAP